MLDYRIERVGCLIQEKISSLIAEEKIKDPRVSSFLSITRVVVSRDLSFADVYVSNIRTGSKVETGVKGLESAAGFIQSCLGTGMRIRKIPKLRFHVDKGMREGFDLIKKIDELNPGTTDEIGSDTAL